MDQADKNRTSDMAGDKSSLDNPIASELIEEDPCFADVVEQFVCGLDVRLATMEQAIRASDFEALRLAAHQLKGSGGGYGYPDLTEQADTLEECAKARALEGCTEALDELKRLCRRVALGLNAPND